MASLNRVLIIGNLGQDPDMRHTPNGAAVCTLNVATTDSRTDKEGNRQEQTEWHRIIVWNKQAENCAKYLQKGRTVFVEGRLQTRSWDDKTSGQKRYATEIIAQTVQFIGGARNSDSQSQGQGQGQYQGGGQGGYQREPSPSQYQAPNDFDAGSNMGGFGATNLDDIPF